MAYGNYTEMRYAGGVGKHTSGFCTGRESGSKNKTSRKELTRSARVLVAYPGPLKVTILDFQLYQNL